MADFKIDEIDKQILFYLIKDTRIAFTDIAKKMNVSPGTIHIRTKKLENIMSNKQDCYAGFVNLRPEIKKYQKLLEEK